MNALSIKTILLKLRLLHYIYAECGKSKIALPQFRHFLIPIRLGKRPKQMVWRGKITKLK